MHFFSSFKARLLASTFAVAVAVAAPAAHATSVPWTGDSIVGNQETISVTPFFAGTFLGATGSGTFGQDPGTPQSAQLAVEIGGNFVTVSTSGSGDTGSLASLLPTGSFTPGVIDAIRLTDLTLFGGLQGDSTTACTFFGGCFQNLNTAAFSFGPPITTVPEPMSAALLVAGVAGLGVVRARRRRG